MQEDPLHRKELYRPAKMRTCASSADVSRLMRIGCHAASCAARVLKATAAGGIL